MWKFVIPVAFVAVGVGALFFLGWEPLGAPAASAPNAVGRAAADGKSEVRLNSLRIDKSVFHDVSLGLTVTCNDKIVLEMNEERSRVLSFTDDLGTDLAGRKDPFRGATLDPSTPHEIEFEVTADKFPKLGATRLAMDAHVVLLCGANLKVREVKGFQLKAGSVVHGPPFDIQLTQVSPRPPQFSTAAPGPHEVGLELTFAYTNRADCRVQGFRFFDSSGREISARSSGFFCSVEGGVRMDMTEEYALSRKVEEVTLQVLYCDELEEVVVPIRLKTGIGF